MKLGRLSRKSISALSLSLLAVIGFSTLAQAAPPQRPTLQTPQNRPLVSKPAPAPTYTPDLLLVMPNDKAEKDDIADALKEVHGTVVGTIGHGDMTTMIIKTEKGKLEETEKKLMKDKKNFSTIGRNYSMEAMFVPNDPDFSSAWHLPAMNCPRAWDRARGTSFKIAVFDTGCQAAVQDLSGKTYTGFNAQNWLNQLLQVFGIASPLSGGGANTDRHGHGTWVATSAAAQMHNLSISAGIAPSALIYPVRIADAAAGGSASTNDITLITAMDHMLEYKEGFKLINISYGRTFTGLHNQAFHSPLHRYFKRFHDRGGLIFISAGNDGTFDGTPNAYYLQMVSALGRAGGLASFSNYGAGVDFTAPGEQIIVTGVSGERRSVRGTSFSSPICAGVAALVWRANPSLGNYGVLNILRQSCSNITTGWNVYYGYGLPDANRAVRLALGLSP